MNHSIFKFSYTLPHIILFPPPTKFFFRGGLQIQLRPAVCTRKKSQKPLTIIAPNRIHYLFTVMRCEPQKKCLTYLKSHFSPINRNNFNFSTNKSLSYFFLGNLLLLSKVPFFFQNGRLMAVFWLKSHFSPINSNNFNFSTNKSLSYFFLGNLLSLSKLPIFSKWQT